MVRKKQVFFDEVLIKQMKSKRTGLGLTQTSTPKTLVTQSDETQLVSHTSFLPSNRKMQDFMAHTMDISSQARLLNRTASLSRPHKSRISILPLTREKVRVGQRGWKRTERGTAGPALEGRLSPSGELSGGGGQKYKQFFTMMAFMCNKTKRGNCKLQVLIEELGEYFGKHPQREWSQAVAEMSSASQSVRTGFSGGLFPYRIIKHSDCQLSKLFLNICFQIYLYKRNEVTLVELGMLHRDIEYYSRRLGMLSLTLLTCMDMGRACLDFFDLPNAQHHYTKALKLAVFLGDKYREEVAIDRLGMCEYYRGDMVGAHFYHCNVDRLSNYNKMSIREHYSNEREIQTILQEKTKEKSMEDEVKEQFFRLNKENIEFHFNNNKDTEYTQNNYNSFKGSLKQMIKVHSLRAKMPLIKQVVAKAGRIGHKNYSGQYQLLKASKYCQPSGERSQDEFLQSHKSFNRNNVTYQTGRIDRLSQLIHQILNFFQAEARTLTQTIHEQRESLFDDN